MSQIEERKKTQFYEIVEQEKIYPIFQPIVSLKNGEVLGYEALTRLDEENCLINTEEFFHMAEQFGCLWKVEEMCRYRSLMALKDKKNEKKIFLNVDPNVIKDPLFRKGVTTAFLKKFNLYPEDIVFEITERNSIEDGETFQKIINHYKIQNFEIAIDDFGNGYAGMNRICALEPQYIKIDREIVHDINRDSIKKSLVESMIQFCKKSHIHLIAEGIETEEELFTLIGMGVSYGQGYYLKKPARVTEKIPEEISRKIRAQYDKCFMFNPNRKVYGMIGEISSRGQTIGIGKDGKQVYNYMCNHPNVTEMVVLDGEEHVKGLITKNHIMKSFGGMYGYGLSMKKKVEELMVKNPLIVDSKELIDEVSRRALMRSQRMLYEAVIVTKEGTYLGVVTVKDLLEAAISIQVHKAVETNPLTGLPGNALIDSRVTNLVNSGNEFSIAYLDLDNFKAYNDAYGFNNGDKMIQMLADCMRKYCIKGEFLGHVGGDDFVLIEEQTQIMPLLEKISGEFSRKIQGLYRKDDYERGYIISKNRHGEVEKFPMATISMAVIVADKGNDLDMDTFSKLLVKAKKESKEQDGNSFACQHVPGIQ